MWSQVILWCLVWMYLSKNFESILEAIGIKHTPRKIKAEVDEERKWKFANTRTSLIHSTFAGFWGLILIMQNPKLFTDCDTYDSRGVRMACCCFGYFLYDSIDLIKKLGFVKAHDILVHHAIVFGNLSYLTHHGLLMGGVVTGLCNELANITLHIRMIVKMSGRNPENSSFYRWFRWLNLLCYVGLRIIFHGRITHHCWVNLYTVGWSTFLFLMALNIMILIFATRLIKTDFLGGWRKSNGEYSTDVGAKNKDLK